MFKNLQAAGLWGGCLEEKWIYGDPLGPDDPLYYSHAYPRYNHFCKWS
jgi:hypothetical protein